MAHLNAEAAFHGEILQVESLDLLRFKSLKDHLSRYDGGTDQALTGQHLMVYCRCFLLFFQMCSRTLHHRDHLRWIVIGYWITAGHLRFHSRRCQASFGGE